MLLEFGPFLLGGFAVFLGRSHAAPAVEEGAVGTHKVFLEHRQVGLGGVEAAVPEQAGGDVDGKPAGDGVGGEHPPEIVGGVLQRAPAASRRPARVRVAASVVLIVDVPITMILAPCRRWNKCGSGGPVTRSCGS